MSDNENALTVQQAPTAANFLAVIAKAAADPNTDVAKMHGLLDVQERMMAKQAEIDFNQALFRAQKSMPRIKKNGEIKNKAGNVVARYMKFDDIDETIRAIYEAEGFCLVDSQTENQNGTVTVKTTLIHQEGHSMSVEVTLPKDKENALKSSLQAAGGTVSVGKRLNTCNLFRIVGEDEDKEEAISAEVINDEQAALLKDLIRETGADVKKFLAYAGNGVESVDMIPLREFDRCRITLEAKKRQVQVQQ